MPSTKFVPLAESERTPVAGAKVAGDIDPNEVFEITVKVRSRTAADKEALLKQLYSQPPGERQYLSRDEFSQKFGADPADLEKVESYAQAQGLKVVESNASAGTVILRGTAQTLTAAFPTELKVYNSPAGRFRGRTGAVQVPEELQGIVEGIFGFDNRPQAQTR